MRKRMTDEKITLKRRGKGKVSNERNQYKLNRRVPAWHGKGDKKRVIEM